MDAPTEAIIWAGLDRLLARAHRYFKRDTLSAEGWSLFTRGGRDCESFYRERWQHDKVVRSTHGVNCTGSCSWMVYVKYGFITWETQAVDYPSIGPDTPEYEPRGCPRGTVWASTMTIEGSGSRSWNQRTTATRRVIARAQTPFVRRRRHWAQTAIQAP